MVTIKKYIVQIFSLLIFSAVLSSCVKDNEFFKTGTGDQGRGTLVRITDADELILRARDVAPTIDTFVLMEIRRDPATQSEMNSPLSVTLIKNSAYISTYNAANSTSFVELPAANYTLLDDINITFQPGEFSKSIRIRLNKAGLDLSQQYVLPYTISQVGSGAKISPDFKNALVQVIIKNRYDGVYKMTGTVVDVAVPAITAKSPATVHLVTTGANSVELYNSGAAFASQVFLFPIMNAGSESAYGGFLPEFTFDANGNVTAVTNAYGQPNPANTRSAQLDPSGVNKWVNGVLQVKFFMFQPNTVASGPRATIDVTLEYQGPR